MRCGGAGGRIRTLVAVALVTATAPALAADTKNPKPAKATVTVKTAPAAQVTVVAPATPVATVAPAPVVVLRDAPDRAGFSAGALVGLASTFGFGFGVRAGYTLPFRLYLGAAFAYFLDGTDSMFSIGPEVGFDIALPGGLPLMLRPYVGLGYTHVDELIESGAFVAYPGVEFLYEFVPHVFAGIDIRVPFVTVGQETAVFNALLTAGYKM